MQHVLNKLTFEIACADEQQAFKTRKSFSKEFYDALASVMEKHCNLVSEKAQPIRIDKLEINLNAIRNIFSDRRQFLSLFEEVFEQELRKKTASADKSQTLRQSYVDILSHFLLSGTLPWWVNEKEADMEIWCEELRISEEARNFIVWLKKHHSNKEIWSRIAFQLPRQFKSFIIASVFGLSFTQKRIQTLYKDFKKQYGLPASSENNNIDVINDFVLKHGYQILDSLSDQIMTSFEHKGQEAIEEDSRIAPEKTDLRTHSKTFTENLFQKFLATALSDQDLEKLSDSWKQEVIHERKIIKEQSRDTENKNNGDYKVDESGKTKMKINQAGIILIAPYLKDFFQRLKLWKEGKWITKTAQHKAVYLLHYLTTGKESPYEYELILEKTICGIPLESPLDKRIHLTDIEKQETVELLESVIQHWKALKNTSVAGLRHSFLQREGLLSRKDDGWLLQIERKTMDVLLEQLPWGYAMVSLPWNQYLIYTEW